MRPPNKDTDESASSPENAPETDLKEVIEGPTGHDAEVRQQQERRDHQHPSQIYPCLAEAFLLGDLFETPDRAEFAAPPDHDRCDQGGKSHTEDEAEIENDERPSAVRTRDIGESPDVAEPNRASQRG